MLHALAAAAIAAGTAGMLMIPPDPSAQEPATVEVPHLKIDIQAYDASGHRVPFDGVVTVVDATSTGMLPVHADTSTAWFDLPLAALAVPMAAGR